MVFQAMLSAQVQLIIYLAIGILVRKTNIIKAEAKSSITDFTNNIIMPCMILDSFNLHLTPELLREGMMMLCISFGTYFVQWLLSKLLYVKYPHRPRAVLQYATLVSNAGFAGLPIIKLVFGGEATFYATMFVIPARIFVWTAGLSLYTNSDIKTKIKRLIKTPALIACAVGLVWALSGVQLPEPLTKTIATIGDATTMMCFVIIGMILADVPVKTLLHGDIGAVAYISVVRLAALPLLALVVLRLLGTDPMLTAITVIDVGMPAGATTAVLAAKYDADAELAAKVVSVTTLLSLLTVPLLTLLL